MRRNCCLKLEGISESKSEKKPGLKEQQTNCRVNPKFPLVCGDTKGSQSSSSTLYYSENVGLLFFVPFTSSPPTPPGPPFLFPPKSLQTVLQNSAKIKPFKKLFREIFSNKIPLNGMALKAFKEGLLLNRFHFRNTSRSTVVSL